jgi:hypothetical protein
MTRYRDQVASALRSVTIHGPARYTWLGTRNRPLPRGLDAQLDEGARRRYLALCLREELYRSFYCHGEPVPTRRRAQEHVAGDPSLARNTTFQQYRAALEEIAVRLARHLAPSIPAFTLELAPGVGLAEDDGSGESFGVRRCDLLADATVRAYEQGVVRIGARMDVVATRFAEAGVQLDAPYREPSLVGRHVL